MHSWPRVTIKVINYHPESNYFSLKAYFFYYRVSWGLWGKMYLLSCRLLELETVVPLRLNIEHFDGSNY